MLQHQKHITWFIFIFLLTIFIVCRKPYCHLIIIKCWTLCVLWWCNMNELAFFFCLILLSWTERNMQSNDFFVVCFFFSMINMERTEKGNKIVHSYTELRISSLITYLIIFSRRLSPFRFYFSFFFMSCVRKSKWICE